MKAFRLNTVNSDGGKIDEDKRVEFHVIDPDTGKPFKGEDGHPCVTVTLKPITPKHHRSVVAKYTERIPARKGEPSREVIDWDEVTDELAVYAIESWTGFEGADGKPLQCVVDAKVGLPGDLKNSIVERALKGEAVEVTAASFRQSA